MLYVLVPLTAICSKVKHIKGHTREAKGFFGQEQKTENISVKREVPS